MPRVSVFVVDDGCEEVSQSVSCQSQGHVFKSCTENCLDYHNSCLSCSTHVRCEQMWCWCGTAVVLVRCWCSW